MSILYAIFNFLCEILLGCRHDRLTRPFTIEQQTYKVCLSCGKHIFYSADAMRPLSARELRRMQAVQSGELYPLQQQHSKVKVIPGQPPETLFGATYCHRAS